MHLFAFLQVFDVETGVPRTLHKLNKDGWTDGCGVPWICFMALDVLAGKTSQEGR